jgi:hypothetical protein
VKSALGLEDSAYEAFLSRPKLKKNKSVFMDLIRMTETKLPMDIDRDQDETRCAVFLWVDDAVEARFPSTSLMLPNDFIIIQETESNIQRRAKGFHLSADSVQRVYDLLKEKGGSAHSTELRTLYQISTSHLTNVSQIKEALLTAPNPSPAKKYHSKQPLRDLPQKGLPPKGKPALTEGESLAEGISTIVIRSSQKPSAPNPYKSKRDVPAKAAISPIQPVKRRATASDSDSEGCDKDSVPPPTKTRRVETTQQRPRVRPPTHSIPLQPVTSKTVPERRTEMMIPCRPSKAMSSSAPASHEEGSDEEDSDDDRPKRFRPVFLTVKQWRNADSRVEDMYRIQDKARLVLSKHCRQLIEEYKGMVKD